MCSRASRSARALATAYRAPSAVVSTLVIVTHNLQQAARISDFAGFMYLGEMLEFGTVQKIFVHPDEPRTERFVTGRFG